MVGYYLGNIGIRQEEDESSILTLSLKDSSPARAEDMLNMLIAVYNEEAVNDKNQVAINTADFINADCRYFFRSGNVYERIAEIQFRCHGIGNPVAACRLHKGLSDRPDERNRTYPFEYGHQRYEHRKPD